MAQLPDDLVRLVADMVHAPLDIMREGLAAVWTAPEGTIKSYWEVIAPRADKLFFALMQGRLGDVAGVRRLLSRKFPDSASDIAQASPMRLLVFWLENAPVSREELHEQFHYFLSCYCGERDRDLVSEIMDSVNVLLDYVTPTQYQAKLICNMAPAPLLYRLLTRVPDLDFLLLLCQVGQPEWLIAGIVNLTYTISYSEASRTPLGLLDCVLTFHEITEEAWYRLGWDRRRARVKVWARSDRRRDESFPGQLKVLRDSTLRALATMISEGYEFDDWYCLSTTLREVRKHKGDIDPDLERIFHDFEIVVEQKLKAKLESYGDY